MSTAPQPGENAGGQPRVHLDLSRTDTIYANFFATAGTADEVTVYLGAGSPLPGVTEPQVRVSHRLMLNPQNAKRLMIAMQQTLRAHEERFGPIELPPQRRPGPGPSA